MLIKKSQPGRIVTVFWRERCLFLSVDTNIAVPAVPEKSSNQTDDLSLLSTPSESQTTTSQVTTASTSQTTPTSPPHVPHDTPVDTTITHSSIDPTSLPPDSISTSKQPAEPKIHPTTPAPTPEPPKPETTITTTTTTATSTQSKSTPSPSSSQESPNIESLTPTSPSQSHTTRGQTKSTTTPSSSSTPQTKAHADTPSQLNVGGDSKCKTSSVLVFTFFLDSSLAWYWQRQKCVGFYNRGNTVFCFPAQTSPPFYTHTDTHRHTHATHAHLYLPQALSPPGTPQL